MLSGFFYFKFVVVFGVNFYRNDLFIEIFFKILFFYITFIKKEA